MKTISRFGHFQAIIISLLIFQIFVLSCQSEYTKLVNKELGTEIKHDTLLFDLKFGDSKRDFFEKCWKLNKQGIATHGPSNKYVQTILSSADSLKRSNKIQLLFYSLFNPQNKTVGMDMKFSYVAWAPWNDHLQSDKLLPVVQDTLMKWYPGNKFIKVNNNLIKVDGNRQIKMKIETTKDVSVLIENLEYKYNQLVKK